ncbi:MAG: hypothetical protein GEU75_05540 [Dehalococcoidia bacterium]|nr:hypothetical protein [Dehalococcoidia bacterium]
MRKTLLLVPVLVGLAFGTAVLVACGSGDDDDGGGGAAQPTAATSATAAVTNLTVTAGDWYFEPNNFMAKTGIVRVSFNSMGPMFPHTFAVKNLNGEGELFSSDRVENGQMASFEFTVSQPGAYQVICVVRGHVDRGQTGTLTVTAQ